jgi:hypothetical protein
MSTIDVFECHLITKDSMFACDVRTVSAPTDARRATLMRAFPAMRTGAFAEFFEVVDTRQHVVRVRLGSCDAELLMHRSGTRNSDGHLVLYVVESVTLGGGDAPVALQHTPLLPGGHGCVVRAPVLPDGAPTPTPDACQRVPLLTWRLARHALPTLRRAQLDVTRDDYDAPLTPLDDDDARLTDALTHADLVDGDMHVVRPAWLRAHGVEPAAHFWASHHAVAFREMLTRCMSRAPAASPLATTRLDRVYRTMHTLATLVVDHAVCGASTLVVAPRACGASFAVAAAAWSLRFHGAARAHLAYAVPPSSSPAPSPPVIVFVPDTTRQARMRLHMDDLADAFLPRATPALAPFDYGVHVASDDLMQTVAAWREAHAGDPVVLIDDAWAMSEEQLAALFQLHLHSRTRVVWTGVRDTVVHGVSLLDLLPGTVYALHDTSVHAVTQCVHGADATRLARITTFSLRAPEPSEFALRAADARASHLPRLADDDTAHMLHTDAYRTTSVVLRNTNVRLQAHGAPSGSPPFGKPVPHSPATQTLCDVVLVLNAHTSGMTLATCLLQTRSSAFVHVVVR